MVKVKEILRPAALSRIDGLRKLAVWLAYHGVEYQELARRIGVTSGTLHGVLAGLRTSRPLLEAVSREAGLEADELQAAIATVRER